MDTPALDDMIISNRRTGKGRTLVQWDATVEQQLLLAIEAEALNDGLKLNWSAIAKHISPTLSGEAVKQHLAKITKSRKACNLAVPKRRVGGPRKTAKDAYSNQSPPHTPIRAQESSPAPPKVSKRKRPSGRDTIVIDKPDKPIKIEEESPASAPIAKQFKTGNGRKKRGPRQSNFILTEQYKNDFYAAAGKTAPAQPPTPESPIEQPGKLREKPQKNYAEMVEEEIEEVDNEKESGAEVEAEEQKPHDGQLQHSQTASIGGDAVGYAALGGNVGTYASMAGNMASGFGANTSLSDISGGDISNGDIGGMVGGYDLGGSNGIGYASSGNSFAPRMNSMVDSFGGGFGGQNWDFSSGDNQIVPSQIPHTSAAGNFNAPSPSSTHTTYGNFSTNGAPQMNIQSGSFSNSPTETPQNTQTSQSFSNHTTSPASFNQALGAAHLFGGPVSNGQSNSFDAFSQSTASYGSSATSKGMHPYGNDLGMNLTEREIGDFTVEDMDQYTNF